MADLSNSIPTSGAPAPQAFRATLARSRRAALEGWIERAIRLLDALDGDPDLEPDIVEPDHVPTTLCRMGAVQ